MKRSEMIEIIIEYLVCDGVLEYSLPETTPVKFDDYQLKSIAEGVLRVIEEEGMLPPTWIEERPCKIRFNGSPTRGPYREKHNSWEPEDEDKSDE